MTAPMNDHIVKSYDNELKRLDEVSAPVVSDYPYGAAGAGQRHRAIDVID